MSLKIIYTIASMLLLVGGCNSVKENQILPQNAQLELISNQFSFTEGPTADAAGNIFFTDQPDNKVYKYGVSGKLEVFMEEAGRANGLYYADEYLWLCADGFNELWKYDLQSDSINHKVSLKQNRLNGPNDVWIHENKQVFFTDPMYQRPYWKEKHDTLKVKGLYSLDLNLSPILLDSSLVQPNGIVGDSKNNLLYVADIGADKVYRYKVTSTGKLMDKTLFIEKGSDGMTIDDEGNLYITGKGVDVYNCKGKHLLHIKVPQPWTANICFGGEAKDELFITASKAFYKIKTLRNGIK